MICACLKRKCYLPFGSLTFYPNMYIVLVGPSGCRKGTAMGPGYDMLREIGIKMAAEAITREALIQELRQCTDALIDVKEGRKEFHASLTVFSKELTVFLGYNNQQLMADMADWYDCGSSWTYRTKNMGTDEIINVWVNLIGATTPELLQSTLPRDAIGGGLTSRIIFVFAPRKAKFVVPFLTHDDIILGQKLQDDLERIHQLVGAFRPTDEFIDRWVEWYMDPSKNVQPFEDYRFGGYCERRPGHILKLCMVSSAARGDSLLLDHYDLEWAMQTIEWTERLMPRTFSGVGRSQIADTVQRILALVHQTGGITKAEIMQRFYQDLDDFTLKRVISTLQTMGEITLQSSGSDLILVPTKRILPE